MNEIKLGFQQEVKSPKKTILSHLSIFIALNELTCWIRIPSRIYIKTAFSMVKRFLICICSFSVPVTVAAAAAVASSKNFPKTI